MNKKNLGNLELLDIDENQGLLINFIYIFN